MSGFEKKKVVFGKGKGVGGGGGRAREGAVGGSEECIQ